jgi:sec-independent protein translocase protein TatB
VFDLGLTKLAIIGVVALVVIGPEQLPRVARTVGTLLGRAQRYLADVKAEVNREMQFDDLKAMRDQVQSAASSFHASVNEDLRRTEADLNSAFDASPVSSEPPLMTPITAPEPISPAKRGKWKRNVRTRQSAQPLWFRSANRKRTRVQSGAARVARYRPR